MIWKCFETMGRCSIKVILLWYLFCFLSHLTCKSLFLRFPSQKASWQLCNASIALTRNTNDSRAFFSSGTWFVRDTSLTTWNERSIMQNYTLGLQTRNFIILNPKNYISRKLAADFAHIRGKHLRGMFYANHHIKQFQLYYVQLHWQLKCWDKNQN